MARWSPEVRPYYRPETPVDRARAFGERIGGNLASGYFRGREEARVQANTLAERERQARIDEENDKRYQQQMALRAEQAKREAERLQMERDRARHQEEREQLLDSVAGIRRAPQMGTKEGEEFWTTGFVDNPDPTGAPLNRWKPLGGGYYQDITRSKEYQDKLAQAKLGRVAEAAGIDPDLASGLGPDYVQQSLLQRQRDADAMRRAQFTASNRGTGGTGGTEPGGPGKLPPSAVVNDAGTIQDLQSLIQQGLSLVSKNPEAVGVSGYLPNALLNWGTDPAGKPNWLGKTVAGITPGVGDDAFSASAVQLRAVLSNILSSIVKARSGATVTNMEWKRLEPYVPSPKSLPGVIKEKLEQLRTELDRRQQYLQRQYSTERGYADLWQGSGIEDPDQGEQQTAPPSTSSRNSAPPPPAGAGAGTGGTGGSSFLDRFTVTPRRP